MNKYRIVKKVHFRNFEWSSKIYDEAYFVQVKYFLFYRDLHYWTGSDVDDYYMNSTQDIRDAEFPHPYHETHKKFTKDVVCETGEYIFFLSLEAAKFFCEKLKEQEIYIREKFSLLKTMKSKTTEIIDMNDKKIEVKAKVEVDINVENKQEISKSIITEL